MYSPRSQTAAYKLKDSIPLIEKKKRWQILNEILKKTALANNKKLLNKTIDVLVEKENYGHTNTFKQVKFTPHITHAGICPNPDNLSAKGTAGKLCAGFDGSKQLIGKFVRIKITDITPWNLKGKLVN